MKVSKSLFSDGFSVLVLFLATSAASTLLMNPVSAEQVKNGSPFMQSVWFSIYVVILLRAYFIRKALWLSIQRNKLLIALVALAVVSSLWSENVTASFRRSIATGMTTLFAIDFAARYQVKKQIWLVSAAVAIAIALSVVFELFLPGAVPKAAVGNVVIDEATWNGIFSHKNIFGHVLAIGTLCILANTRRTLKGYIAAGVLLALVFSLIAMAQSRTSLLISLLMIALWPLISVLHWRARVARTLGVVVALTTVCVVLVASQASNLFAEALGRSSDLTGRTEIWTLAIESIWKRPLFGYGFFGFWFVSEEAAKIQYLLGWDTPYAHNAYIDITLQLGLVGLALCIALVVVGLKNAFAYTRRLRTPSSIWPLACIVFSLAYGVTESDFLSSNWIFWMVFTAAICTVNAAAPERVSTRLPSGLLGSWASQYRKPAGITVAPQGASTHAMSAGPGGGD